MPWSHPVKQAIHLRRFVVAIALLVLTGTAMPVYAADGTAPAQQSAAPTDLTNDVRTLQRLLQALGDYAGPPSGRWDRGTEAALRSFQRTHRLPVTGELDEPTIAALGGTPDVARARPRFRYVVRPGDTLSVIAARFGSTLPWLVRYNQHITAVDRIRAGDTLVLPVAFPFPAGTRVERVEVLSDRFLGAYIVAAPYSQFSDVVTRYVALLKESGFDINGEASLVDGITLRSRNVLLGRIVFGAHTSPGSTRLDLALHFGERGEAGPPEAAPELRLDEWIER